jgi:hypothetical protein
VITLMMLAVYAAGGGIEFVIHAWLLGRRSHAVAVATDQTVTMDQPASTGGLT